MKLIKGECCQVMSKLPDKSINLIICDLPYGTTANEWDVVINNDDLFHEYKRILTDNGTVLLFGSEPFSTTLRMSGMDIYRYDHIWLKNKVTGFVHAKNKPLKDFEIISVFSKGTTIHEGQSKNKMTYNPQGLIKINKKVLNKGKFGTVAGNRPSHEGSYNQEFTNYPKMTIKCDFKGEYIHPSQKPVKLYEYLIKTYSNPGDVILDNCAGSGTLGAAGLNITDRDYIMIELDHKYQDIIIKRLPDIEVIQGSQEIYQRQDFKDIEYVKSYLKEHGLPDTIKEYPGTRKDLEKFLKKNGTSVMRILR